MLLFYILQQYYVDIGCIFLQDFSKDHTKVSLVWPRLISSRRRLAVITGCRKFKKMCVLF